MDTNTNQAVVELGGLTRYRWGAIAMNKEPIPGQGYYLVSDVERLLATKAAAVEPVAWMLKTGHGTGWRDEPPTGGFEGMWKPLFDRPLEAAPAAPKQALPENVRSFLQGLVDCKGGMVSGSQLSRLAEGLLAGVTVGAVPAEQGDDESLFWPSKALLNREDWDPLTRKPKVPAEQSSTSVPRVGGNTSIDTPELDALLNEWRWACQFGPNSRLAKAKAVILAHLARQAQAAPGLDITGSPDLRNIDEITRPSDQSLHLRFKSTRSCSFFQRYIEEARAQAAPVAQEVEPGSVRAADADKAATIAAVESLDWTINGTWVITKSGEKLHTLDAIAFTRAASAQQASFSTEAELIKWLDNLYACNEGGTIHNQKWEPAQRAIVGILARAQTDLSKRLRLMSKNQKSDGMARILSQAADEIDRYHGGMLAWKRSAEAKDRDGAAAQAAPAEQRDAAELVRIRTIIEVAATFDPSSMLPITENDAYRRILALRTTSTPIEGAAS